MNYLTPQHLTALSGLVAAIEGGAAGFWQEGSKLLPHILDDVETSTKTQPISHIAARYAVALSRTHIFKENNKRIALLAALFFLSLNNKALAASEAELAVMMQDLTAGTVPEIAFAGWLRGSITAS